MAKKSFIGDDGKEYEVVEKVPFYKKKWFIAIAVLFLLGSCSSLLGGKDEEKKEETKTEALVSETETEKKKEVTETETETEVVTETETEEVTETETEFVFVPENYTDELTYDDLARYPEEHTLKDVKYTGRVLQVMSSSAGETQVRLAINDDVNQTIFVGIPEATIKKLGRILEDDWLSVYGPYIGTMEYKTVMGDVRTIPAVLAEHFVVE